MSVQVTRGALEGDTELKAIRDGLKKYARANPRAKISLYRHGEFLIRIRVIDSTFEGLSVGQRQKAVWQFLKDLPEEYLYGINTILCITPKEIPTSPGNLDFEHPEPAFA